MKTPQITITFSPTGDLQAEISGANGARQVIPLPEGQAESTIRRLLKGQALDAAQESWAVLEAHRNHKSYNDQIDKLFDLKHKAIIDRKNYYERLVESNVGVLPHIKTPYDRAKEKGQPKAPKSKKQATPVYNSKKLATLFNGDDL